MLQTGGCVRCWDRDLPGILSAAGIEGRKEMKKSRKNRSRKSQMMLAGLGLCMALGTPVRGMAVLRSVETAAERTATASDAVENIAVLAADEEIWGADVGDMSFLSGRTGDEQRKSRTRSQRRSTSLGSLPLRPWEWRLEVERALIREIIKVPGLSWGKILTLVE